MRMARKIDVANWCLSEMPTYQNCPADAICVCLRTTKNKLSVWEAGNGYWEDAALALILSSSKIHTFDLIVYDDSELSKHGIRHVNTASNSPHKKFNAHHYDLEDINYSRLGIIIDLFLKYIVKSDFIRIDEDTAVSIIDKALQDEKISPEDLSKSNVYDKYRLKKGLH